MASIYPLIYRLGYPIPICPFSSRLFDFSFSISTCSEVLGGGMHVLRPSPKPVVRLSSCHVMHYGSKQSNVETFDDSISHELGSE